MTILADSSPQIACAVLTSEAEAEAVADEWRNLQDSDGVLPFTSYDWFDAWWKHLGKPAGNRLHIVIGRRGQRLVAVLPLTVEHRWGARILRNIGVISSYICDCLSESSGCIGPLLDAARRSRLYDFAILKDVNPDSELENGLASFARRGGSEKFAWLHNGWSDGEAWRVSLSKNRAAAKNRAAVSKRRRKRLQEKGEVRFTYLTTAPIPADMIDDIVRQKKAWASRRNKKGIFDQPDVTGFLHRLTQAAAEANQLCLSCLQCGDRTIAYQLAFLCRGIMYGYIVSNDQDWAPFSPGNMLMDNFIAWIIDKKIRDCNWMQGVSAYKLQYANLVKEYPEWVFSVSSKGFIGVMICRTSRAARLGIYRLWKRIENQRNTNPTAKKLYEILQALRRAVDRLGKTGASSPPSVPTANNPHQSG
jgi:CelD/BcsL family acetyltransferase involved in cellulose biosynthesis